MKSTHAVVLMHSTSTTCLGLKSVNPNARWRLLKPLLMFLWIFTMTCNSVVSAQAASSGAIPVSNFVSPFKPGEVAVLIVMGQSNSIGWSQFLPDNGRFNENLTNVFGINNTSSDIGLNQDFNWTNYSVNRPILGAIGASVASNGNYHLAGEFAQMWQSRLNSGSQPLPNLYIIHIGQGATSFAPGGAWAPNENALYPLAKKVIQAGLQKLITQGLTPRVIGLHWNQWESEAGRIASSMHAESEFRGYLQLYRDSTGDPAAPTYLYYPRADDGFFYSKTGTAFIADAFKRMTVAGNMQGYHLIDAGLSPYFNASEIRTFGIFSDGVHYTGKVQTWFAVQQWNRLFADKILGGPIFAVPNGVWQLVLSGDFNGDTTQDGLYRNYLTGSHKIEFGGNAASSGLLSFQPGSSWTFKQAADFDGDGKADLLLRHGTTNLYTICYIDGLGCKPNSGPIARLDSGWEVVKAVDLDGDKRADLVLRLNNSKNYAVRYLSGLLSKSTISPIIRSYNSRDICLANVR